MNSRHEASFFVVAGVELELRRSSVFGNGAGAGRGDEFARQPRHS